MPSNEYTSNDYLATVIIIWYNARYAQYPQYATHISFVKAIIMSIQPSNNDNRNKTGSPTNDQFRKMYPNAKESIAPADDRKMKLLKRNDI